MEGASFTTRAWLQSGTAVTLSFPCIGVMDTGYHQYSVVKSTWKKMVQVYKVVLYWQIASDWHLSISDA